MEAFRQLSANRDVMVLEGGRSWREGYLVGLSARRVVELAQARVLIVLKYDDTLLVDRALAAQDYFGGFDRRGDQRDAPLPRSRP